MKSVVEKVSGPCKSLGRDRLTLGRVDVDVDVELAARSQVKSLGNLRNADLRDHQWAQLVLRFTDTENGHTLGAAIDVLIPKRPDATMSELAEAAQSSAKAILAASLDLLQESTVAELEAQEHAASVAEDAELNRQLREIGNPSR